MKSGKLLPYSLVAGFALALGSQSVLANRPTSRPRHHVPPTFRKFIAAHVRVITLPPSDCAGSSSISSGSLSLGASFSSGATLSINTGVSDSINMIRTGAGTAALGGTLTFLSGGSYLNTGGTTTTSLNTGLTLGAGFGTVANPFTNSVGRTLVLGNGSAVLNTNGSGAGGVTVTAGTIGSNSSLTINTGVLNAGTLLTSGGTLTFTGANNPLTFAGAFNPLVGQITIATGTLLLPNPVLPDLATLALRTGGILTLDFTGTDTVNQLQIDGVAQPPGVYGSLSSDAPNKTALITGTGTLTVTSSTAEVVTTTTSTALITAPPGVSSGGILGFAAQPSAAAPLMREAVGESSFSSSPSVAAPATEPVPEPSSAALFAAGAGMLFRRWRKRD